MSESTPSPPPPASTTLPATHGTIHVLDTGLPPTSNPNALTLLLIHGNSSSTKVFSPIFSSPALRTKYRILAFDLPGHGDSSNALDPQRTYSMRGYADLAHEITQTLQIRDFVALGWSLGGHIAIELLHLLTSPLSPALKNQQQQAAASTIKGICIIGTPPANGMQQISQAFHLGSDPLNSFAARDTLADDEIPAFGRAMVILKPAQFMESDVRRTHGIARKLMWQKFAAGDGVDQVRVIEGRSMIPEGGVVSDEKKCPLVAVINGTEEPYVNLDYLDGLKWKRLWRGQCFRVDKAGHGPFWERWDVVEPLLEAFMRDCED